MTGSEFASQERHGKRLDKSSQGRRRNDAPPLTTTGLDLRERYKAHVKDAFVPKAKTVAHHMIVQFPTELVDGEDPELMLKHARAFGERVFGKDAIFADRVDRDERSRHVVDLFIAPKYVKETKRAGKKVSVAMTLHMKQLAKEYGQPLTPQGQGRALQDALFEYLRDEMGLEGVQRGEPKAQPGPDWKAAEELREAELRDREAAVAADRDALKLERSDFGREKRDERSKLEGAKIDLAANRGKLREAEAQLEADRQKLRDREAAVAADRDALERGKSKLATQEEVKRREAAERAQKAEQREKAVQRAEDALKGREASLAAYEAGMDAYVSGDLIAAVEVEGRKRLRFRDDETRDRLAANIKPAFEQVWKTVRRIQQQLVAKLEGVVTFLEKFDQATVRNQDVMAKGPKGKVLSEALEDPKTKAAIEVAVEEKDGIDLSVLDAMRKRGLERD